MLGNAPFSFKTTEKITAAFGWIFQDLSIERKDSSGRVLKTIKVPIELATKEKWAQRALSDPNAGDEENQKHVQIVLPRMAYEMTNMRYDAKRKLSPIVFRSALTDTNTTVKRQLQPVPMVFDFSLYLQTRTLEDGYAIMEQFIPYFQPDFTVPVMMIPEMNLQRDIIFNLIGNSHEDSYEGQFLDKRILEWQFDFEARGEMYPPIREKKVITQADIYTHDQNSIIKQEVFIDPTTAKQNDEFKVSDR
jgi:hypothetical protein